MSRILDLKLHLTCVADHRDRDHEGVQPRPDLNPRRLTVKADPGPCHIVGQKSHLGGFSEES
jgi:hypothetical protein